MPIQLINNNKNNNFIMRIFPTDIWVLIFEYEGEAKKNNENCLKEFKKILESQQYYGLAFRLPRMYDDDNFGCILRSIRLLNTSSTYKFILNQKKTVSYCNCDEACCYQFHYDTNKQYICRCHEKKSIGGITYSYPYQNKKFLIRKESNGFCVKICENKKIIELLCPETNNNYISKITQNSC
jgi:hypothetical protein